MSETDRLLEWGLKGCEGWLSHAERLWAEQSIRPDILQRLEAVRDRLGHLSDKIRANEAKAHEG